MTSGALLVSSLAGCALEAGGEEDLTVLSTESDELFVASTKVWKTLSIPVCFEQDVIDNIPLSKRTIVKDTATASWQKNTRIKFTGWGTCTSGQDGIHIGRTNGDPVTIIGRGISTKTNGMLLNFEHLPSRTCSAPTGGTFPADDCLRWATTHEFGHALGFDHEQDRPDNILCPLLTPPRVGDVTVGPYDLTSTMSYCRFQVDGALSSLDLLGAHFWYGDPKSSSLKKDAIVYGSDAVYFFMGTHYTKYGFAAGNDKVQNDYPQDLNSSRWPGWPCDVWLVPTKGAEMCADPTIPGFLLFLRHAGYRGALELGGGPLPLLVTPPPDAREERSLRVLRIEPKPIPADRFVAPDGYQRAPVRMVGLYDDVRRGPIDEHP